MKARPICLVDCGRWMGVIILVLLMQRSQVQPAAGADQIQVHLPSITRNWPAVILSSTWTAKESSLPRNAFVPGETIRFYAGGPNQTENPAQALITITLTNACETVTIFNGLVNLDPGFWTQYQTSIVPECYGLQTATVQLSYQGYSASLSSQFVVNRHSQSVVRSHPAFDKCNIPSLGQMNTWWTTSPYYSVNLYIGGIHRACSNSGLDAFWVHETSKQGWTFIPTWVGPQAPCTSFKYRFSPDIATAYEEGRSEADQAARAAENLGFIGNKIVYYDMEAYSGANQACREAVKSFIRGWVERLHELGLRAGVYGSSCSSYMYEWASINPSPDNVWIASWYTSAYDPYATVWGVRCLADSYWPNQQRIRQYTGDHREDWGGVSMAIDSNVANGEVTFIPQGTSSPAMPVENVRILAQGPQIQDMGLITADMGWTLIDNRLMWTQSGGSDWIDLTPQLSASDIILAADFLDAQTGWILTRSFDNGKLKIWHTNDGFDAWQSFPIRLSEPWVETTIGLGSIHFQNTQVGSIILELESSSNFNLQRILRTTDGGLNWSEESENAASPVLDGVASQNFEQAEALTPEGTIQSSFISSQFGWSIIKQYSCEGEKGSPEFRCVAQSKLARTVDGGITWQDITP